MVHKSNVVGRSNSGQHNNDRK